MNPISSFISNILLFFSFQSKVTPCSFLTLSKALSIGFIFSFNLLSEGDPKAITSPVTSKVPALSTLNTITLDTLVPLKWKGLPAPETNLEK